MDPRRQDHVEGNHQHGIENAPAALLKLLKGENLGKMLVKLR